MTFILKYKLTKQAIQDVYGTLRRGGYSRAEASYIAGKYLFTRDTGLLEFKPWSKYAGCTYRASRTF